MSHYVFFFAAFFPLHSDSCELLNTKRAHVTLLLHISICLYLSSSLPFSIFFSHLVHFPTFFLKKKELLLPCVSLFFLPIQKLVKQFAMWPVASTTMLNKPAPKSLMRRNSLAFWLSSPRPHGKRPFFVEARRIFTLFLFSYSCFSL